jgi:hypothetical protein
MLSYNKDSIVSVYVYLLENGSYRPKEDIEEGNANKPETRVCQNILRNMKYCNPYKSMPGSKKRKKFYRESKTELRRQY